MSAEKSHAQLATELRARVVGSEVERRAARTRAVALGAGSGPAAVGPAETLAAHVGANSYRVTDEQVAAVRRALGSDRETFEVVMAASVGAGLRRWDAALRAIEEATGAPS